MDEVDENWFAPTETKVVTLSTDTRIERLDDGDFFATHVAWPGMWGTGPTPEAAVDELIDAFRGCKSIWPNYPEAC